MPGRGGGGGGGGRRGGGGRGGGGSRGGGRGSKPQRGSRSVPTEEEVLARNATPPSSSEESEEEEAPQQEQQQHPRKGPVLLADSDGDEPLLGAGNPNRNPDLHEAREPTRREREAMEKARQAALMQGATASGSCSSSGDMTPLQQLQQQQHFHRKLQAEGKTSQAKADLARQAGRDPQEKGRGRAGQGGNVSLKALAPPLSPPSSNQQQGCVEIEQQRTSRM
ncbi:hypothetical protein Emed_005722 [Eimeria media]